MEEQTFFQYLQDCLDSLPTAEDNIIHEIQHNELGIIIQTKNLLTRKTTKCILFEIDVEKKLIELSLVNMCFIPAKSIIKCIIQAAKRVGISKITLFDASQLKLYFDDSPQIIQIDLSKFSLLKYGKTWYSHHFGFDRAEQPSSARFLDEVNRIVKSFTLSNLILDHVLPAEMDEKILNELIQLELNLSEEDSSISESFTKMFNKFPCEKKANPWTDYSCVLPSKYRSKAKSFSKLVELVWEAVAYLAGGDSNVDLHYELDLQSGGGVRTRKRIRRKRKTINSKKQNYFFFPKIKRKYKNADNS